MPEINPANGKIIIRINASSLVYSKCIKHWHLVIIDGYKEKESGAAPIYGVAVHRYIDTMFKTKGRIDLARNDALAEFNKPKHDSKTQSYLSDVGHLQGTCYNLWEDYVDKDKDFQHLMLNSECYWCKGKGCTICDNKGYLLQPATEVTFRILYYQDDKFEVWLEGTIDKIGKIVKGCYCVADYKTTSSGEKDKKYYLENYEMSAQLRFYVLSTKLMAEKYPDSILGQIGKTRVGAFIDGIFLKSKASDNCYQRSDVFQFTDEDLSEFRFHLDNAIQKLIGAIITDKWNTREGIFNGACEPKFGSKCPFWFVCRANKPDIQKLMLARDFVKKQYNPLKHND